MIGYPKTYYIKGKSSKGVALSKGEQYQIIKENQKLIASQKSTPEEEVEALSKE